jgi:hypothetical protein
VIEAIRLHAHGALLWLDGALDRGSGGVAADGDLRVTLDPLPRFVRAEPRPGMLVLHAPPAEPLPRFPTEAERRHAGPATLRVSGMVHDAAGRFLPRRFGVDVAARGSVQIPLFRTPGSADLAANGGLLLALRWRDVGQPGQAGAPASWTVLSLALEVNGTTWRWNGQADRHGDVAIALRGLPPRPKAAGPYTLVMTASGDPAQSTAEAPDPALFRQCRLQVPGQPGQALQRDVTFTRGAVLRFVDPLPRPVLLEPV